MTRERVIQLLEYIKIFENGALGRGATGIALDIAIAALREQPRWISVEERLPDGNAKCLVSIHYRDGYDTIDVLWFRKAYKSLDLPKKGDYWLRYDSEYGDIDMTALVTHWMPLPEGPEVEV
jgi:hypothetical protein